MPHRQQSMTTLQSEQGFTLIELITVIVILSIVSIGLSGVLRTGSQAYVDATQREQLLRQGSFVLERLNREMSNAVPNSVRVDGNAVSQCVEFVPINWSTAYLTLPILPSTDRDIDIIKSANQTGAIYSPNINTDFAIVYPTDPIFVYDLNNQRRRLITACSDDGDGNCATNDDADSVVQLTVSDAFELTSPANRLYVANQALSYCVRNNSIYRHESAINTNQTVFTTGGTLMAEGIENVLAASVTSNTASTQNPFRVIDGTLRRHAYVQVQLIFSRNEELMPFVQEVHIPNVP